MRNGAQRCLRCLRCRRGANSEHDGLRECANEQCQHDGKGQQGTTYEDMLVKSAPKMRDVYHRLLLQASENTMSAATFCESAACFDPWLSCGTATHAAVLVLMRCAGI
jgi:hypothetical protein